MEKDIKKPPEFVSESGGFLFDNALIYIQELLFSEKPGVY